MQRFLRLVGVYKTVQRLAPVRVIKAAFKFENGWSARALLPGPITTLALVGLAKMDDVNKSSTVMKENLIAEADALFDAGEYKKASDLLSKYRDTNDVEILWRLSRSLYWQSKDADPAETKRFVYQAHNVIELAMKLNENHPEVYKLMVILLDTKNCYEGVRARLNYIFKCKEHIQKAIELNPKDAAALHMLGNWYFSVADLPWYQRKIISAIFGVEPMSSFEEALEYFETAEKIKPMFYSRNLLFLAKTYLKLGRKDEAMKYLKITVDYPAKNYDDYEARSEATKIIKKN